MELFSLMKEGWNNNFNFNLFPVIIKQPNFEDEIQQK